MRQAYLFLSNHERGHHKGTMKYYYSLNAAINKSVKKQDHFFFFFLAIRVTYF